MEDPRRRSDDRPTQPQSANGSKIPHVNCGNRSHRGRDQHTAEAEKAPDARTQEAERSETAFGCVHTEADRHAGRANSLEVRRRTETGPRRVIRSLSTHDAAGGNGQTLLRLHRRGQKHRSTAEPQNHRTAGPQNKPSAGAEIVDRTSRAKASLKPSPASQPIMSRRTHRPISRLSPRFSSLLSSSASSSGPYFLNTSPEPSGRVQRTHNTPFGTLPHNPAAALPRHDLFEAGVPSKTPRTTNSFLQHCCWSSSTNTTTIGWVN